MIAEKERDEVLTTLASTQNEELFQQVLALVRQQAENGPAVSVVKPKAGFLRGSVVYHQKDWDAPLPDDYWKHQTTN